MHTPLQLLVLVYCATAQPLVPSRVEKGARTIHKGAIYVVMCKKRETIYILTFVRDSVSTS